MASALRIGAMAQVSLEIGKRGRCMGLVALYGAMAVSTKGIGNGTGWMVMGS